LLKFCWVSSSKIKLHSGLIFLNNNKSPQFIMKNAWSRHIFDPSRIQNLVLAHIQSARDFLTFY
jgi:hypothetical protein